jgi:hypothetical protein
VTGGGKTFRDFDRHPFGAAGIELGEHLQHGVPLSHFGYTHPHACRAAIMLARSREFFGDDGAEIHPAGRH